MSELRTYKEKRCCEKIIKILENDFRFEIDKLSEIITDIRDFYKTGYQGRIFTDEIIEYLHHADDKQLDKIIDFEVNMNNVFIEEINLLRRRIEEIEENYVRGDDE